MHTLRAVIDPGGQRVDARDRLYLADDVPTLLVWGASDPIIPAAHGRERARADAGQPARVASTASATSRTWSARTSSRACSRDFVATTEAAELDTVSMRERLVEAGQVAPAA